MVDVEIVRTGQLRYKPLNQPSKSSKEYWFVFRTKKTNREKVLEYYLSEKDYHKKPPKDQIPLKEIQSVQQLGGDSSKSFSLTFSDGVVHTFESHTTHEIIEWVFALNAVLFGKGPDGSHIVRFYIEVWSCPLFHYSGPGILEIRNDEVVVWSQNEASEVVRWKMGHIRSFKAKLNHQLQINAGSRSATGEGIFVFGTQESILITHTLETVIHNLAKKKNSKDHHKRAPPIPPAPYHSKLKQETLVRGRTDTNDQVPGFTDVPGKRGPDQLLGSSSTPYDQLSHSQQSHSPIPSYGVLARNNSGHVTNQGGGDYDVLRSDNFTSSSEERNRRPDIYGDMSASASYDTIQNPSNETRRANRRSQYQYTDTLPQLLPKPTNSGCDANSGDEFGEVRHVSSRNNSRNNSCEDLTKKPDAHSVGSYAFLKPVAKPLNNTPPGMYDSLNFQDGDTRGEQPPPPPHHHQPPRFLMLNDSHHGGDYDTLAPTIPPKKTEAASYDSLSFKGTVEGQSRDIYSTLSPETPTQPPLIPPRKKTSEQSSNGSYSRINSPPSPFPPSSPPIDIEILYDTGPPIQQKPTPSPRVSPNMSRKVLQEYEEIKLPEDENDYDTVAPDETEGPTHHMFEDHGEYSKFNRSEVVGEKGGDERREQEKLLPYSQLSYSGGNEQEENAPYNMLVHKTGHSGLFDDKDYEPLMDDQYSEMQNKPNDSFSPTQKSTGNFDENCINRSPKPADRKKPLIPPRVKTQEGNKSHDIQATPVSESHDLRPTPPKPKPKPKPKRNVVVH